MKTISVILITLNEERNIRECLASVRWANEIIVVDSGSHDQTVRIARELADKVIVTGWTGYAQSKNLALQHASSDWVLWIDADERVTAELRDEIRRVLAGNSEKAGYEIPRKAYFLGRWIKHCGWYPAHVLRLFRRGKGVFNDRIVHEGVQLQGFIGRLSNALLHFTDDTLDHYMDKFNTYTSLAAKDLSLRGKKAGLPGILFRPLAIFIKMFFLKKGFLDGVEGFMLCLLSANYVAFKYAKLWEKRNIADVAEKAAKQ